MTTSLQDDSVIRTQRYEALSQHPSMMGIDYIKTISYEVTSSDFRPAIAIYFVPKDDISAATPNILNVANFKITDAVTGAATHFNFETNVIINKNAYAVILVLANMDNTNEFNLYSVELIGVPNIDPYFRKATFARYYESTTLDCVPPTKIEEDKPKPEIDYLAKDYVSLRNLMLDRLSLLNPDISIDNVADLGMAIVETLAYATDQLSYYQDAVATEAYLSTARQRVSVKRHARLLDYNLHEGCNARTWVHIETSDEQGVALNKGTQLMSHVPGFPNQLLPDSETYKKILNEKAIIFETMHNINVYEENNKVKIYTWGSTIYSLPQGATQATLYIDPGFNPINLEKNWQPGSVLIFQEEPVQIQADGNTVQDLAADPKHRHAVRLTKVTQSSDPLGGRFKIPPTNNSVQLLEIEWQYQDALPFELIVAGESTNGKFTDRTVVLGNIVLADHGSSYINQPLQPAIVPENREYRPIIKQPGLTFRTPYDETEAKEMAASLSLLQDVHSAYAIDLKLKDYNDQEWISRDDLLSSQHLDKHFVVEINNDRHALIRFGDQIFGEKPLPGTVFQAGYRIGNGGAGNIGAESLAHIVTDEINILSVVNPLSAVGGTAPESIEHIRLYAPHDFKKQERCVTLQDYVDITQQHPDVKQAKAGVHWTGAWNTVLIAVTRKNDLPIDDNFKNDVFNYLQEFRLIGHDIKIISPQYVPLDIVLVVHTKPDQVESIVKRGLLDHFSSQILANGKRGFFHPDNFDLGKHLYLSHIVNEALTVPGVAWIDVTSPKMKFQAKYIKPTNTKDDGVIKVNHFEIIQVLNDINNPEYGVIDFLMENKV